MRVAACLCFVGCLLPLTPASASDVTGRFQTRGPGTMSCGTWTQEAQTASRYANEAWILGFLTAYGRYVFKGSDIARGADNAGLTAWVDNYCAAHPLETVVTAAQLLIEQLAPKSASVPARALPPGFIPDRR
jgi:hypothetical protein